LIDHSGCELITIELIGDIFMSCEPCDQLQSGIKIQLVFNQGRVRCTLHQDPGDLLKIRRKRLEQGLPAALPCQGPLQPVVLCELCTRQPGEVVSQ
ncbi:hypothetical protein VO70_21615, partial [Aeromonas salmonicida]